MPATLADIKSQVTEELRPVTPLEHIFAHEVAYATWELERVRALTNTGASEPTLNAAYTRAARNWTRARKELQRLQTARLNHLLHVSLFPMADPARVPAAKPASRKMEIRALKAASYRSSQQEEN